MLAPHCARFSTSGDEIEVKAHGAEDKDRHKMVCLRCGWIEHDADMHAESSRGKSCANTVQQGSLRKPFAHRGQALHAAESSALLASIIVRAASNVHALISRQVQIRNSCSWQQVLKTASSSLVSALPVHTAPAARRKERAGDCRL